jgi:hypothetical protein
MNYLLIKKQILEMKLELTNLQLEKHEIMRQQHYEKAAEIRDREYQLNGTLDTQRNELIIKIRALEATAYPLEEMHTLISLLSEFNQAELIEHYTSIKNSFMDRLKTEYEQLWIDRRVLQKEARFKEANIMHEQLIEIGKFLVKYGKNNV